MGTLPQFFTHTIDSLVSCNGKACCSFVAYTFTAMQKRMCSQSPSRAWVTSLTLDQVCHWKDSWNNSHFSLAHVTMHRLKDLVKVQKKRHFSLGKLGVCLILWCHQIADGTTSRVLTKLRKPPWFGSLKSTRWLRAVLITLSHAWASPRDLKMQVLPQTAWKRTWEPTFLTSSRCCNAVGPRITRWAARVYGADLHSRFRLLLCHLLLVWPWASLLTPNGLISSSVKRYME